MAWIGTQAATCYNEALTLYKPNAPQTCITAGITAQTRSPHKGTTLFLLFCSCTLTEVCAFLSLMFSLILPPYSAT